MDVDDQPDIVLFSSGKNATGYTELVCSVGSANGAVRVRVGVRLMSLSDRYELLTYWPPFAMKSMCMVVTWVAMLRALRSTQEEYSSRRGRIRQEIQNSRVQSLVMAVLSESDVRASLFNLV